MAGTGALLIVLGLLIGFITITGRWPGVVLSLTYPQDVKINK